MPGASWLTKQCSGGFAFDLGSAQGCSYGCASLSSCSGYDRRGFAAIQIACPPCRYFFASTSSVNSSMRTPQNLMSPSCMRQKLVPRTVRRPSPACGGMVRLRSTNTNKIQFTHQRLPLGPELHMGKERCCLRGLDHLHGPTSHSICGNFMIYKPSSDRFMFEHDESLRADLLLNHLNKENGRAWRSIFYRFSWMKNHEHKNFWFTMFPEKRFFSIIRETTAEVAIHTNPFTDLYAPIGTGWYTIMILPFLFSIRIGFLLAASGGSRSLLRQLKKEKLHWNR